MKKNNNKKQTKKNNHVVLLLPEMSNSMEKVQIVHVLFLKILPSLNDPAIWLAQRIFDYVSRTKVFLDMETTI